MSEKTAIQWTDATWNPWHGCKKVSPGCAHCYMYRDKERYGQDPTSVVRSKTTFRDPLKWKEPKRVFTCSWSDFFIEEADAWRNDAWDIIRQTPHLTYQILTKRPERMFKKLPWHNGEPAWKNVWLGVSVESGDQVDRINTLMTECDAHVKFLSCEPLLGPVSFKGWVPDWVIVGGESGPLCRPMDLAWVRDLRDQCAEVKTPFFMKQLGGERDHRGELNQIPEDLRIRQFPAFPMTAHLRSSNQTKEPTNGI